MRKKRWKKRKRTTEAFANVPAGLQGKMESCVQQVKDQGFSKERAIAICHAQLVEGKDVSAELSRVTEYFESRIVPTDPAELTGREWDVTIIGPADDAKLVEHGGQEFVESANGRLYSVAGLRKSVPDWEGVKVFDNHLTDEEFESRAGMRSPAGEWLGSITRPAWDARRRAITGVFKVIDEGLARKLKAAWEGGVLKTIGLSIDTIPEGREAVIEGRQVPVIEGFEKILSVDLVAEPAAGGRFNRILAAKQRTEANMFTEEQLEQIRQMIAEALAALKTGAQEQDAEPEVEPEVSAEEAAEEVVAAVEEVAEAAPPDADPAAVAQAAADAAQQAADEVIEEVEEEAPPATALEAVRRLEAKILLRDKLDAAKLPPKMQNLVTTALGGKAVTGKQMDTVIKRAKEAQAAADTSGRVRGAGSSRVRVGIGPQDKFQNEVLRLFMGNSGFRALEHNKAHYVQERLTESYQTYVKDGRVPVGYRSLSQLIYDVVGDAPIMSERFYEALTTSNMTSIVKNALNLMLAANYSKKTEWWDPIVRTEEVDTIDQATLVRVYGMDTLDVVDEGQPYTELDWRDDEEVPTFVKRGNYIAVTLETMLNDKLSVIRMIPERLATSWHNTLSTMVSNVFTVNTATGPVFASDTGALFNATAITTNGGHVNLLTASLSYSAYGAARTAMMKQTDQYSGGGTEVGKRLLIQPKYILVPVDLEQNAKRIRNSEFLPGGADNDINPYREDFDVVVVPEFTDANNWALVADTQEFPAIWLIFLRGRRVPELFTADSEVAGSMFTNDTIRYKVRLMTWRFSSTYDCAPVADFRPLHKSNVA